MAARNNLSEFMIELVLPCAVRTSSYVFDLTRLSNAYDAKTVISFYISDQTI